MPIKTIDNNTVYLKDGTHIKIVEVEPINFELKSDFEQTAILESYRRFLKACNFDMQVVAHTELTDISNHLKKVRKLMQNEDCLNKMADDYICFVQDIISSRKNVSRKFYIVIKGDNNLEENILKIKEGLNSCGNFVQECTTEKLIILMKNCFNRRLRGLERKMI